MNEPILVETNEYIEYNRPEYKYTFDDYIKIYEDGDFDDYEEYI